MNYGVAVSILIIALGARSNAQTNASALARAFQSLNGSQIQNEIFIPDHVDPGVVVLYTSGTDESISLISLAGGVAHLEWHLSRLPKVMSVVNPNNLSVKRTDSGIVILLHGCAPHLCGGRGTSGALAYVATAKAMYMESATWDSSSSTTKFHYSHQGPTADYLVIKQLLAKMLQDEGYRP